MGSTLKTSGNKVTRLWMARYTTVQLKALNALIVPLLSPHIQHELAQYKEPKVAKHKLSIH